MGPRRKILMISPNDQWAARIHPGGPKQEHIGRGVRWLTWPETYDNNTKTEQKQKQKLSRSCNVDGGERCVWLRHWLTDQCPGKVEGLFAALQRPSLISPSLCFFFFFPGVLSFLWDAPDKLKTLFITSYIRTKLKIEWNKQTKER